ncbi:hypothetical protein [Candidatus Hoaglandella endobia]|uniref:hypothetical protein n=1 Tax=Candidatus Hoaglandella endobia TaxID=1778263 RepID=UPI0013151791|nr:hypothetical protein [Candidatus Hoaglandella endobia]
MSPKHAESSDSAKNTCFIDALLKYVVGRENFDNMASLLYYHPYYHPSLTAVGAVK